MEDNRMTYKIAYLCPSTGTETDDLEIFKMTAPAHKERYVSVNIQIPDTLDVSFKFDVNYIDGYKTMYPGAIKSFYKTCVTKAVQEAAFMSLPEDIRNDLSALANADLLQTTKTYAYIREHPKSYDMTVDEIAEKLSLIDFIDKM